jgi:hypothetical protein
MDKNSTIDNLNEIFEDFTQLLNKHISQKNEKELKKKGYLGRKRMAGKQDLSKIF